MKRFGSVDGFTGLHRAGDLLFILYHNCEENSVFDIKDKDVPSFLTSFFLPVTNYGRGLRYAYKRWFFFFVPYEGFYLLDLEAPNSKVVKLFSYFPYQFQHLKDDYFIGTGGYGGIYKIDNSYHPKKVGRIGSEIYEFFIYKDHLFGACKDEGLKVFNITIPDDPRFVSQPFENFLCMSVEYFHEKMGLVKNELGHILIVDISNPKLPKVLSSIEGKLYPYKSFFASYPYLIVRVTETDHILKIFDYSNPMFPRLTFSHAAPKMRSVIYSEPYVAMWSDHELEVLNLTANGELTMMSSYRFSEEIYSVVIIDNYIYLSKSDGIFLAPLSKDRG